jgi:predicted nucleic acid-binding protein
LALIIDTSVLLAALDRREPLHSNCRRLLETTNEALYIPSPVLVEVDYWIRERLRPEAMVGVLDDIRAGAFHLVEPLLDDLARAGHLILQYADSQVGFVDAAVLAIVERLNEPKVATLDQRHFRMMRPRHVAALTLLPE